VTDACIIQQSHPLDLRRLQAHSVDEVCRSAAPHDAAVTVNRITRRVAPHRMNAYTSRSLAVSGGIRDASGVSVMIWVSGEK